MPVLAVVLAVQTVQNTVLMSRTIDCLSVCIAWGPQWCWAGLWLDPLGSEASKVMLCLGRHGNQRVQIDVPSTPSSRIRTLAPERH